MKITDALLGEHGAFGAEFDRLDEAIPHLHDAAQVREQAALLAAALITHAMLEDELLFGALAGAGADAGLLARMDEEHQAIADGLAQAQGTGDAAHAAEVLLEAVALARDHFEREERLAFPLAETLLGPAALERLGADWAARRRVWLEPHPV